MAQQVDYIRIIPTHPPADIVQYAVGKGVFGNLLIFRCGYIGEKGSKVKVAKCVCSHCGHQFNAVWIDEGMGCRGNYRPRGFIYKDKHFHTNDRMSCPACCCLLNIRHVGDFYGEFHNARTIVQQVTAAGQRVIVSMWQVWQKIAKDGHKEYSVLPYEHFIFEKRTAATVRCYGSFFSRQYPCEPRKMSRFTPPDYTPGCTYPLDMRVLKGTYMENSRLDVYLNKSRYKSVVQHLRCYQDFNRLDVLLDSPLVKMIVEEEDRSVGYSLYGSPRIKLQGLNRKEKSPFKILGLDREEMRLVKQADIEYKYFLRCRQYRDAGGKLTKDSIKMLIRVNDWDFDKIIKREDAVAIFRYLAKDIDRSWRFLDDYWRMASLLGYDLANPLIQFPRDLRSKHDEVMAKVKWKRNEAQRQKFADIAAALSDCSFADSGWCIRIAQSEDELISEGKTLHHCVGGYGQRHVEGDSIFFVRKADVPDVPLYTLQIELKTGNKLQLHGYNNERDGQVIPPDVFAFIAKWQAEVFRPFDVEKMKFIKTAKVTA